MKLKDFVQTKESLVVAHRGSSGTAPENTLAAIDAAISAGAQMIEIDVQLTADAKAVVFHDTVLGRTTSGHGKISATTYEELQNLDAGSWFSADFAGEKIPLLHSALECLRGRAFVNIEIKPPQKDEDYHKRVEIIADIIFNAGFQPYTLFSSFHHDSIAFLKTLSPDFHTAAINVPGDTRLPSEIARATKCEAFVCSLRELTKKRADDLAQHGIYGGAYTVNSPTDVQKALDRHARALVTNFPARVCEAIGHYNLNANF